MKVLALILVIAGAIGTVGSTTAPAPTASASTTTTTTTATQTQDRFERPPRMAASLAPVAAVAKPPVVAKKVAPPKAHKAVKKAVKKAVVRTYSTSSGKCGATCQWAKTASVWKKYPAWVQTFALCVSHHESWSGHMWTAENPISTASGGFQWLDRSWRVNLARAGFRGPGHAAYASPILQAEVTAWVITHKGQRNWAGAGCGYGT